MKIMPIIAIVALGLMLGGCTNPQSSTQNDFRANAENSALLSNTGQNAQLWPDGSQQTGATQLDSGVISPETTNWMGTAVSSVLAVNKNGVQVKNTGDLDADSMKINFGEPYTESDGTVIVPIVSIEIAGLKNASTPLIEASTEQVSLWTGVLGELSDDQREAVLAGLERDKVIASETVGLIRAALEAASPAP